MLSPLPWSSHGHQPSYRGGSAGDAEYWLSTDVNICSVELWAASNDCEKMSTWCSFGLTTMVKLDWLADQWPPKPVNMSLNRAVIAQIFAMATYIVRVSLQQYKSYQPYTWECDQLRIRQCGDQMIEVAPCPMSNVQWPMASVNLWLRALLCSGQDYYQGQATVFKSKHDKIIRTVSLSEATW